MTHQRRMLFSSCIESTSSRRRWVLLEFDADQRLWQDTVRDAVAKQCPASLVREHRRERSRPRAAVEDLRRRGLDRADRPGERRRTGDRARGARPRDRSDAVPGHRDAVRAAGRRPLRPAAKPAAAIYAGITAHRDADGWVLDGTARYVLDGDRAERFAVVTDGGVFLVDAAAGTRSRRIEVFDPVLHVADVSFAGVRLAETDRLHTDAERAHHVALMGIAITTVGACQRILDLVLEHVKRPSAVRRRRSARSRPSSTRPSTCTSPSNAPARCRTSRR